MKIEVVPISAIKPSAYNPRKDLQPGDAEYEKLKKSITEFDMVEPLVWNKRSGNLVGGHQRLKILKELDYSEVEVSVVDLPEAKEKALNLALNKISGEWDLPALKDLLEELDTGDFDMEITGFDLKEIEDLMTQFHVPEEGLTDDDAVPEATESICRKGDLWSLGNHKVLCGDATLKTDVERLMGGEKADLVFTDPPYGIGYKDVKGKHEPIVNDKGVAIIDLLALLPSDCPSYVCCNWKSYPEYYQAIPDVKALIVWDKGHGVQNLDKFYKRHEFIIYRGEFGGQKTLDGDVWLVDREVRGDHPTAKPVELISKALGYSSYVGNIVLDLFGGSGSTLIACEKLGRRCFMMEISEMYCTVILKRWEAYTGKDAVREDGRKWSELKAEMKQVNKDQFTISPITSKIKSG